MVHQDQDDFENGLCFAPEVVKMLDGERIMDSLSINDIAFTCVAFMNCVEVHVLNQNYVSDIGLRTPDHSITNN